MKVSDLIKVLEEYKDLELYHLNVGNPIEVNNIKTHVLEDCLFLELKGMRNSKFITEMESIDEGFSPRLRTESEMKFHIIDKKLNDRAFNYFFEVGTEVVLDEEVLSDMDKERFGHLIGQVGIVKKCDSDIHGFAHGTSYGHAVEWKDGTRTQDIKYFEEDGEYDENFMPKNYLATVFLKRASED